MNRTIHLLLSGSLLVISPALAQLPPQEEAGVKRPCDEDMVEFCKGTPPGKYNLVNCLRAHEDEISSECKGHLDAQKTSNEEALKQCAADKTTFCPDVGAPGPGKEPLFSCLRAHRSEVSAACGEALDNHIVALPTDTATDSATDSD
jgi:hypothetical protein